MEEVYSSSALPANKKEEQKGVGNGCEAVASHLAWPVASTCLRATHRQARQTGVRRYGLYQGLATRETALTSVVQWR